MSLFTSKYVSPVIVVSPGVIVVSGGVTKLSIIVSGRDIVESGLKSVVVRPVAQLLTSKAPVVALPQKPSCSSSQIVKEESKYSQEPSSSTAKVL